MSKRSQESLTLSRKEANPDHRVCAPRTYVNLEGLLMATDDTISALITKTNGLKQQNIVNYVS